MASIKSAGYLNPQTTPNDGCAVFLNDSATISANPTAADTVDFLLPAGQELSVLRFVLPDMDTGGSPAMAGKIGYAPVASDSTLTGDDDYFRATAAIGQAAGLIDCAFAPVMFQEDVKIQITWTTAAATFAAGSVYMVAGVNSKGAR